LRAAGQAIDPHWRMAAVADRVVAFVMPGLRGPIVIASPLVVWFLLSPRWIEWLALPAPLTFVPEADALVGYGVAFGLGWLVHRQLHLLLDLWCWVLALVGGAVRYLSGEHRVTRYLAEASYWIYLMHIVTTVFFITAMRPYDWHWSIKFTVCIVGSMPILLVTYHYWVRHTWIGAVLNGRRLRAPHKRDRIRRDAPGRRRARS
jgi:hypothetical protein